VAGFGVRDELEISSILTDYSKILPLCSALYYEMKRKVIKQILGIEPGPH
jgi:hypothetical protein